MAGVPYTFSTASQSIPLAQLDANFATPVTLGQTTVALGQTVTTITGLTLANVNITSGNVVANASGNVTFGNTTVGLGNSSSSIGNLTLNNTNITSGNATLTNVTSTSTLDGTGNSSPTTTVIKGSAKAWVNFVGSTAAINGSFNVSSITRTSAGQWTVTMTNAMTDTNYAICTGFLEVGTNNNQRINQSSTVTKTTTVFGIAGYDGVSYSDFPNIYVSVFR